MENKERFEKMLRNWEVPEGLSEHEAWNRLEMRIQSLPAKRETSVRSIAWVWTGVAAAAVIAGFFIFSGPDSEWVNTQAEVREHKKITLPDQSEVILNAGSTLLYPGEWADDRLVRLDGQAFFNVSHGSEFVVETETGKVTVLGTSFDVCARGDNFQVWCHSGKVEVEHLNSKEILTPGEMAFVESGRLSKVLFDPDRPFWVDGEFRFENQLVSDVFQELSRQTGVSVTYHGGKNRRYTGAFTLDNFEDALRSVCLPMGMEFERRPDGSYSVTDSANNR